MLAGPVRAERDELVETHLGLVGAIARAYASRRLDREDLIAAGRVGLIRAAERFDPDRGFAFSTYATFWIRQEIREALRLAAPLVAPPRPVQSIPQPNREVPIEEFAGDNPAISRGLESREDGAVLRIAMERLSDRERLVITRRFGLDGEPSETLAAIGRRLSLTRERVRQIERSALDRLREEYLGPAAPH